MAEPLVESVVIGAERYRASALVGAGGGVAPPSLPAALALTDASIAAATGASQIVAVANPARLTLNISNPGAASWWINETGGVAAAGEAGCFELIAGARWTPIPSPTNAVTGIGTAAAKLTVVVG